MTPTDLVFQTVSNLTGGLITDVTTAVVGLVTLGFVVMGLDLLKGLLLSSIGEYKTKKARNEFWAAAGNVGKDMSEFESEEKEMKYQAARRRYSSRL